MFETGHATRQPPHAVRELYREWLVGLNAGERAREQRQHALAMERERARIRREDLEDERLELERMKAQSVS